MPEILSIGSFLIQVRLLILILSILIAYYVVRWKLGRIKELPRESGAKLLDKFLNAFIIAIFVWKFTPLIKDPSLIWTKPFSILTYTGGTTGILFGTVAGLLYAVVALWRARLLTPLALDVLAFSVGLVLFPYRLLFWEYGTLTELPWGIALTDSLLRYHPVNLYAGLIAAAVILYVLLSRSSRFGKAAIARDSMLGLGLGWFAVTFFKRAEATFLLTTEQWLLLAVAVVGMMMPSIGRLMELRSAGRTAVLVQESVAASEEGVSEEEPDGGEEAGASEDSAVEGEGAGSLQESAAEGDESESLNEAVGDKGADLSEESNAGREDKG